jgi:acetyl/propionyl-CoA carboxylase alpha subunit/acetyl-CoA carboxylase carboxyltransferase component
MTSGRYSAFPITRLFIANRGEIAIRIARAASELGIDAVAAYAKDDAGALHVERADEGVGLSGEGVRAYLDIGAVIAAAKAARCDAIHPGYGFLSENAAFARACAEAGLIFVGPSPETLDCFGDKARARAMAKSLGAPVIEGTDRATSLEEAEAFLAALGPGAAIMLKALAGGGGRGMRVVDDPAKLKAAYARCRSEALAAFGSGDLYVERLIRRARHVEVQLVGDGRSVAALSDRDCTLQRRHQKLIEIAPAPSLDEAVRACITEAALELAREAKLVSLCTFEFLIDRDAPWQEASAFIEANPRLQVEHTVTEEITGLDLVQAQIAIAGGARIEALGIEPGRAARSRGMSMELRINAETVAPDGRVLPSAGPILRWEMPAGPGVRVDAGVRMGAVVSPNYDSLLAKVIVHAPSADFGALIRKARRALAEVRVAGVETNARFLEALLERPEVAAGNVDTGFIERNGAELAKAAALRAERAGLAGGSEDAIPARAVAVPPGMEAVVAPMGGRLAAVGVSEGGFIRKGQCVAVIESMKMEHLVESGVAGTVRRVLVEDGAVVGAGSAILLVEPAEHAHAIEQEAKAVDLDAIRPDLAEMIARHSMLHDERRPDAVGRRRASGQRTARENVEDLCDQASFVEYGGFAVAAQRRRRDLADLIAKTPADGIITGVGTVNAPLFGAEAARAAVLAYDFTVLAGTQGYFSHKKTDRLLGLADQWRLPVVVFGEGGGGRPGDTDAPLVAGLDVTTFAAFARLSGKAPLVGIVSGRCFAGNAALIGSCDVVIATKGSNLGMGGPAMIEGGGLGVFAPEAIGPLDVQSRNGVVDVACADEAEATAIAKRYLSYFQGALTTWEAVDQRLLRHCVPENRLRVYPVREIVDALFDARSVLELRRDFGRGIVTALVRLEGRPLGVMTNDPAVLGGAIDAEAADKAARFMRLCEAHGLPIVSLIDTPGFMVGPKEEENAQVRRACAMFLAGARISTPFLSIVLRKGYGLGAQAMAAGSFRQPAAILSWPTGEFGGMGLEGAVRLGYRKEMEAIQDPERRDSFFKEAVARLYETGKATNMAAHLEIDGVIDPAETRATLLRLLKTMPQRRLAGEPGPPPGSVW